MGVRLRISELIEEKSVQTGQSITQKDVARDAQITESTLSRYAKGFVGSFNGEILERLADYFNVEVGQLFIREDRRPH